MVRWTEAGELIPVETIAEGLESMPGAFAGVFRGANCGKMLVRV